MIDFNKYFIVGTNSDALHDTMNGTVVGELIRCKDCARWVTEDGKTGQCLEFSKVLFRHATIAEFFCAMAKPRWTEK